MYYLLPFSFDVSSMALLHLLDKRMREKSPYSNAAEARFHIVSIDTSTILPESSPTKNFGFLKERFPQHNYAMFPLEDLVGDLGVAVGRSPSRPSTARQDSDGQDETPAGKLSHLLKSLPSATSKADVLRILKRRGLLRLAESYGCKGVLWTDTATELAERTLAETAKGHGYSLPWQISDGTSRFGIPFYFPLRDFLRKEMNSFLELAAPQLQQLIIVPEHRNTASSFTKNDSLDTLMNQYIGSAEENYPNIVANVIRTSSKLQAPKQNVQGRRCFFCTVSRDDTSTAGSALAEGEIGLIMGRLGLGVEDQAHEQLCQSCVSSLSLAG